MAKIKYKDPNTGEWTEIKTGLTEEQIVDLIYPIGSVYMSSKETSPVDLFGGYWMSVDKISNYYTWKRISDEFSYSVAKFGSGYDFTVNSNGYYESQNKGVNSSYSLCKITMNVPSETKLTISYISSGESSYDFGIFSNIDTELAASNSEDSTGVFKSCKGEASTDVKTLTYTIPAGEHFITIKYRKDGSSNSGNDSLQFKLDFDI